MAYARRFLEAHGQDCKILRTPVVDTKISIKRSTRAIRDFGAREAHWEGLIPLEVNLQSGELFEIDGKRYLVQSVVFDPASRETACYVVKTNCVLQHQRQVRTVDKTTKIASVSWDTINENIDSYGEIVTVEMRHRDPGILQATRYIFQLPKALDVRQLDRIVFNGDNYRVDAINDVGMEGIVRIQVSEDNRT